MEAALGSDTHSCIRPVISKNRPAVPFSFYKFDGEAVVFKKLKPGGHEMGPGFDYLTHGAVMGYSRGCADEYCTLPWTLPSCLLLCVPAFICSLIRHLVEELSSL